MLGGPLDRPALSRAATGDDACDHALLLWEVRTP